MENVEESEAKSVEELELEDFDMEKGTASARHQFVDKMQKAFNDWELKQKEAGKQRTLHHYPKNSQRTQRRHRKAAKEKEKEYNGNIYSLLLKAGVCHVIKQEIGHRSPCFRHGK
jgi:homoaconitase/3-isopropylmalate dehydratase large subunit